MRLRLRGDEFPALTSTSVADFAPADESPRRKARVSIVTRTVLMTSIVAAIVVIVAGIV